MNAKRHAWTPPPGYCRWVLRGVLIAGRRLDGKAGGVTPDEAVRHFAARTARELKVDVATAIASAIKDPLKKVEPDMEDPKQ